MSIAVQFHPETHVVCLRTTGEVSLSVAQTTLTALFKNPEFRPGMAIVWDLRRGSLKPFRGDSIQSMVEFVAKRLAVRGHGKGALVVSQQVNYGIGRMFEAYADQVPAELRVFQDFDEAMGWVGASHVKK
jgi:hypothetical protein